MNSLRLTSASPFEGEDRRKLESFLNHMGLKYDKGIEYSVCLLDEGNRIVGSGSVESNVIKCMAVDVEYQGQKLMPLIMSELIQYLFERGRTHIFIYTKPENLYRFTDMGFHVICSTAEILLLENSRDAFSIFLRKIQNETPPDALGGSKEIGAVVAHCNPFTLGHRYLLEEALRQCDYVHLFILSDDRGYFSLEERLEMVKMGIKGLDKVILHQTQGYMVSAAVFPAYFFKDRIHGELESSRLDIEIFASRIAPRLHITTRFVGTEPYCRVTGAYNEEMKKLLPEYGICLVEVERRSIEDMPISASRVRECIADKEIDAIKKIVPGEVYEYLRKLCVDRYF